MNPTGKKFISLFLIFSLMMLSSNLYSKEERGAKLEIWGKGDTYIQGELIAVKQNSLLLLNPEGKDVSVNIEDIEVIRIVKKSKALLGAGLGVLIGGGIGASVGALASSDSDWLGLNILFSAGIGVVVGLLFGIFIGAYEGEGKVIGFEGKSQNEINEILNKLSRKARIRDYK